MEGRQFSLCGCWEHGQLAIALLGQGGKRLHVSEKSMCICTASVQMTGGSGHEVFGVLLPEEYLELLDCTGTALCDPESDSHSMNKHATPDPHSAVCLCLRSLYWLGHHRAYSTQAQLNVGFLFQVVRNFTQKLKFRRLFRGKQSFFRGRSIACKPVQ